MSRKFVAVVLPLAVLAVVSHAAVAGPPERPAGTMVDGVTAGLKQARLETNDRKRFELFESLADTHDPRVAVELAGMFNNPGDDWGELAGLICCWHYAHLYPSLGGGRKSAQVWWRKNGDDLLRRAKQLAR